jgi:hypothetical protein
MHAGSKPKRDSACKRWCFTLPNPTEPELNFWRDGEALNLRCRYVIWGRESSPGTGLDHLQGYLELRTRCRLTALKKLPHPGFARAHWTQSDGTAEENRAYCTKQDGAETFEHGSPAGDGGSQGGHAESERWSKALDDAKAGNLDDIPADIRIRYNSSLVAIANAELWRNTRRDDFELELRPWQEHAFDIIKNVPHSRRIHIVVDEVGASGKSTFARYLRRKLGNEALVLGPGKSVDLAYLIRPARVFILDCPRSSAPFLPWALIEELKDGYIISTKYECVIKEMPIPHVFVFTNAFPPDGCLSADRLDIWDVNKDF